MKISHPMENKELYVKEYYLKALCSLVNCNDVLSNIQVSLLEKLKNDFKIVEPLSKYQQSALTGDDAFIEELNYLLMNNVLKYCFIIDALIIISTDENKCDKQIELVTGFCEVLGITEKEANVLIELTNSIAKQDSESSEIILWNLPQTIEPWIFEFYLAPFAKHPLVRQNDKQLSYYSKEKKPLKLGVGVESIEITDKDFELKNLTVDMERLKILISNCENVFIENCDFFMSSNNIVFKNVKNIVIKKCSFMDFKERVIIVEDCSFTIISECVFNNCGFTYDTLSDQVGGVIVGRTGKLTVESSKFIDCFIKNYYKFEKEISEFVYEYKPYYAIAYISNGEITVSNSMFNNCWSYARDDMKNSFNSMLESNWPSFMKPMEKEKTYDELYRLERGLFPKEGTSYSQCQLVDSDSIVLE
ncbi:right-handed parallel beta-helix repeat-containing protein [Clostridium sp.]|uniref:right-handed parallel beta-helix repeat-containing protein n=1 Tax=Clostridium sp. TaxID=1506 RepID=UPI003D6D6B7A